MRLPQTKNGIDVEQTKEMVDLFLQAGFTYFDTAWAYAGSEDAIRQALVERYPRESFQLATKNAAWINCKTKEEAYAQFDTSLKQTGAGYFDFYLLHNLGEMRTGFRWFRVPPVITARKSLSAAYQDPGQSGTGMRETVMHENV